VIARPAALAAALRRGPTPPRAAAALLRAGDDEREFRRIVRAVLPERADEILATEAVGRPGGREAARVEAFLERLPFPTYPLEEYEALVHGIPFERRGWAYDDWHRGGPGDSSSGETLLLALVGDPYGTDAGARVAWLDAAAALVGAELVARLPAEGYAPERLRALLAGTRFAAAADFAAWVWADTGTVFLDWADEIEDRIEWSPENVAELARQFRRADRLLARVARLARWLEADLPARFGSLVEALGLGSRRLDYLREREAYALEITPAGLVPVRSTRSASG
jgi:hypothetical protein